MEEKSREKVNCVYVRIVVDRAKCSLTGIVQKLMAGLDIAANVKNAEHTQTHLLQKIPL